MRPLCLAVIYIDTNNTFDR